MHGAPADPPSPPCGVQQAQYRPPLPIASPYLPDTCTLCCVVVARRTIAWATATRRAGRIVYSGKYHGAKLVFPPCGEPLGFCSHTPHSCKRQTHHRLSSRVGLLSTANLPPSCANSACGYEFYESNFPRFWLKNNPPDRLSTSFIHSFVGPPPCTYDL